MTVSSRLNVSSESHTFGNFVTGQGLREVYHVFKKFAEKLEPELLLCYGGIGNGKTFLLEATAMRLFERGIFARVVVWSDFIANLKSRMDDKEATPFEFVLRNYYESPVVLLDDYGMGTTDTAWEKSILEKIVDYRYRNRLPMALTTNMEIKNLPVRVESRFNDPECGIVVENKGGDYRRRSK